MLLSITTVSKWFNMSAKSSESGKEIRVRLTSATQFIKCRQFMAKRANLKREMGEDLGL